MVGKASLQPRIHLHHIVHFLLISGKNHNHIGVGLRKHGQQSFDNAPTEVLAVVGVPGIERVGFIDEKHIATSLIEHIEHIFFGVANVASHQARALGHYHIAAREQSQRMKSLANHLGNGGLSRSRISGEYDVVGHGTTGVKPCLSAHCREPHLVEGSGKALLQLSEPDKLIKPTHTPGVTFAVCGE